MATANAIAAVGQAILALVAAGVPRDEFALAQFQLYQAKDFQSPMEEGLSLYLYRITPAGEIRNYPPRIAPDGRRYRQVLPINLHYLLSSWAKRRRSSSGCWVGLCEFWKTRRYCLPQC